MRYEPNVEEDKMIIECLHSNVPDSQSIPWDLTPLMSERTRRCYSYGRAFLVLG